MSLLISSNHSDHININLNISDSCEQCSILINKFSTPISHSTKVYDNIESFSNIIKSSSSSNIRDEFGRSHILNSKHSADGISLIDNTSSTSENSNITTSTHLSNNSDNHIKYQILADRYKLCYTNITVDSNQNISSMDNIPISQNILNHYLCTDCNKEIVNITSSTQTRFLPIAQPRNNYFFTNPHIPNLYVPRDIEWGVKLNESSIFELSTKDFNSPNINTSNIINTTHQLNRSYRINDLVGLKNYALTKYIK